MIYESLKCLADELNENFKIKLNKVEDSVVLSSLKTMDGASAAYIENRIVLTLLNIQNETGIKNLNLNLNEQQVANIHPSQINLHILISANFSANNYPESLKYISAILSFLHNKSVFTNSNTPSLNAAIDKLIIEIENVGLEMLNHIWATLGASYLPSILIKMRINTL